MAKVKSLAEGKKALESFRIKKKRKRRGRCKDTCHCYQWRGTYKQTPTVILELVG